MIRTRDHGDAPPAVRAALAGLFEAALAALEPNRLLARVLRREGTTLVLGQPALPPARLPLHHGVVVVGAGKGAAALARALEHMLGSAIVGGMVIVPPGYEQPLRRVALALGNHPSPDRRSVVATRRVLATLDRHQDAAVLVLLTGGASSLLVAPARGLTLVDKRRTTTLLLASGAPIGEMNAVRKHLSAVKGGRLAAALAGRKAAALVVSDVPGDDLAVIGSGPTVADPTTFAAAHQVLVRHRLLARVPPAVRDHLERGMLGEVVETPKRRADLGGVRTVLLAGNGTARAGVVAAARRAGVARIVHVKRPLVGPVPVAARALATRIARVQKGLAGGLPALLVAGGETTVSLGARTGRGGRNQEVALEVARVLAGRDGWALLAAGTDGIDGPTDAAGAFADGATVGRAAAAGESVTRALERHDAYPLLQRLGTLYRPGPTGTNVADLAVALVWKTRGWRLHRGMIQKVPL